MKAHLPSLVVAWLTALPVAHAQPREVGNLVIDGIPEIPAATIERMTQYANTREALLADWDPAGGMLIVTRFGETPQLHHVAAPGAARRQLTFFAEPITSASFLPGRKDGFVFRMDAGGGEFHQYFWYDLTRGKKTLLTDGKSRNESLVAAHHTPRYAYVSTQRNKKDFDLWLGEVGDREPAVKLAKELAGQWAVVDWSDDDARLLLKREVSINEIYLHVYDVATGSLDEINPQRGARKVAYTAGGFVRGGKAVIYASDEDSETRRLTIHDLASGKKESLTPDLAWDVAEIALSPDGRWLAYEVNEGGVSAVYLAPLAQPARATRLALPRGVVTGGGSLAGGLVFDGASKRLGVTLTTSTTSSDVFAVDLVTRKLGQWTQSEVGGLPNSIFVEPALIEFASFDGRKIPAFVYKPREARKKVPVIINIHGGPESQFQPKLSPSLQFWVNELGVAVIAPNVRGSVGYGKSYLLLDNGMKREDSVKDIGALLDWIGQQPDLDASRVAVYGGSYGGFMVLASLAMYPERIRCGVDVVGISNFVTFLESTEEYRRDLRRPEYGDERDPKMREFLTRISPATNAAKIRSPLFVIQGQNDPRVPINESQQIVKTVRAKGGQVWYLVAKDEGHGFQKKSNKDYYLGATTTFFQRFLVD